MREIASARNTALQRYRALRDANGRRETGLAAAEGFNVLREALLSDVALVQVFLGERARRRSDFEALAARLEAREAAGRWERFAVRGDLLERSAHTESPQGALAVPAEVLHAGGGDGGRGSRPAARPPRGPGETSA